MEKHARNPLLSNPYPWHRRIVREKLRVKKDTRRRASQVSLTHQYSFMPSSPLMHRVQTVGIVGVASPEHASPRFHFASRFFQEERHAADTMAKMTQLANQNAEYNPNLSVAMGVDQPTIVDSGSEDGWSD